MLKQLKELNPSLCNKLISRLEGSLQRVHTPDAVVLHDEGQLRDSVSDNADYSWQLFDQVSLQHFDYGV